LYVCHRCGEAQLKNIGGFPYGCTSLVWTPMRLCIEPPPFVYGSDSISSLSSAAEHSKALNVSVMCRFHRRVQATNNERPPAKLTPLVVCAAAGRVRLHGVRRSRLCCGFSVPGAYIAVPTLSRGIRLRLCGSHSTELKRDRDVERAERPAAPSPTGTELISADEERRRRASVGK